MIFQVVVTLLIVTLFIASLDNYASKPTPTNGAAHARHHTYVIVYQVPVGMYLLLF